MALPVIRPLWADDFEWVRKLLKRRWGSTWIVTRGRVHEADCLPGFVAEDATERYGLATYCIAAGECELVSLDSLAQGQGIGTALLEAVAGVARTASCRRLWLITTNDNLRALGFYQKRGLLLVAVHRNALEQSRKLKPTIPDVGLDGIPLRDEIELELKL